jgi:Uma2 family endonuclease
VIIKVLSDSTEKYDRGKKFEHYRTIPSLREYVLISQDRAHVDRFALNEQDQWVLSDASGLEAVVELTAVDCRLPLAEIYAKVEFEPSPDPASLLPGQ